MNLFKKNEKSECCCGFSDVKVAECDCQKGELLVRVLGLGCKKCHELYENVKEAAAKSSKSVSVEYITDMEVIMNYGVMSMPAVVINEKVVSMGRVLKAEEALKLIEDYKE